MPDEREIILALSTIWCLLRTTPTPLQDPWTQRSTVLNPLMPAGQGFHISP